MLARDLEVENGYRPYPLYTIVHRTDTCRKKIFGRSNSGIYYRRGAEEQLFWGINLGIGP